MPRSIIKFTKETKSVTKTYDDGDTLTIVYRPDVITPKVERLFQEQAKSDTPSQALVTMLPRVVVSWDLLGEDGKPLALTPEVLEDEASATLSEVLNIVLEDMRPDPTQSGS